MGIAPYSFEDCCAVIATSDVRLRQYCRSTLYTIGFRRLHSVATKETLLAALVEVRPQLLMVDAALPDTNVCAGLADLRQGVASPDPFLPVILVGQAPEPEDIARASGAGADDFIVVPWEAGYLETRIAALLFNRKRFVITAEYIGPDRRTGQRQGCAPAVLFTAPNALSMRALERLPPDQIRQRIAAGRRALQQRRLVILAEFVLRVGLEAVAGAQRGEPPRTILTALQRMARAAHGLARACQEIEAVDFLEDIAALVGHIRDLREQAPAFDPMTMNDLTPRVIGTAQAFGIPGDRVEAAVLAARVEGGAEPILL